MNEIERRGMSFEDALGYLAMCQAAYDRLGRIVSTKDPNSLRSACDGEMRELYEQRGIKSLDVKVGDTVVGSYTAARTKEQPSRKRRWFSIGRERALQWVLEEAPQDCRDALMAAARKIAEQHMLDTGELIEGAATGESVEPAVPSRFKNTVLKLDKDKVAELAAGMGGYLE